MNGYIDINMIKASVLLFLALALYKMSFNSSRTNFLVKTMVVIMIAVNIYLYSDALENTQRFKDNKLLICTNHSIGSKHIYLVSKNEGWEIYDSYFKKDSLLIEAYKCKEK